MEFKLFAMLSRVGWQLITKISQESRISIWRVKRSSLGCATQKTRSDVTEELALQQHCYANLILEEFLFSMADFGDNLLPQFNGYWVRAAGE
jgi:hypothetical protein